MLLQLAGQQLGTHFLRPLCIPDQLLPQVADILLAGGLEAAGDRL